SLAPPASAPVAPASTPPLRGGAAPALARTIAAPAPMRTPGTRPAVAPAASKPHRTLTPAQALDLPPPTPAPVLKTPPPIVSSQPRLASVAPSITESDSGPTNVVLPAPEPAAAEPVLKFPDSEPIIDSVTFAPDPEP